MVLPLARRGFLAGRRGLPRPAAAPHGDRRLSPPLPTAPAARPCSGGNGPGAMLRHLARKLRASGPVTVAEYMREALTNPGQVRRARAGRGCASGPARRSPRPCAAPPPGLLHAPRRRRRERGLHHLA